MAQPEIPGTAIGRPVMPYGSDGSNWIALLVNALGRLQVDVITGGGTADGATETTLAALLVELALKADLTELQPVSAEDGDKIWSYYDSYQEGKNHICTSSSDNELLGSVVPQDEVWAVQTFSCWNTTRIIGQINMYVWDGTYAYYIKTATNVAADDKVLITGFFAVPPGAQMGAQFFNVQTDDQIRIRALGYKMKI